jgi:Ni/Fe-hydrogenase subunit HybB-like protein
MQSKIWKEAFRLPLWLYPFIALTIFGTSVGLYRLFVGLGPTTNLNDGYPWGVWIGFDLFMVAFSGGAFTLATIVYVFQIEELHKAMRLAVLTGLLGYLSVLAILAFDLGRWDRAYHFVIYPNINSALFEVSWCIAIYSTILITEFSPVVLQKLGWTRVLAFVKRITIILVIAGATLSTLHQSSLGSMFLVMSHRLHPLWYSPFVPLLFFASSIAAGMATIVCATTLSFFTFKRSLDQHIIAELASYIPWALGFYWILRLGELLGAGEFALIWSSGNYSWLFLGELVVFGIVPIALFTQERVRMNRWLSFLVGQCTLLGVLLNRFNTTWLGFLPVEGYQYTPSWMEIAIQAGVLAATVVVYSLAARYLPLFDEEHHESQTAMAHS